MEEEREKSSREEGRIGGVRRWGLFRITETEEEERRDVLTETCKNL